MAHIDEAIEFPVDSHDNYYVLPAPHYEAPYPLILTESNCINTHTQVVFFCPMRPYWSQLETVAPSGACVVIDDASLQAFAKGCVDSAHGSFINPIDGSTTTPEVPGDFTGTAPPYSFVPPPTDISTTGDFWTESEYLATHTDEIAETSSDDSNESFSSAETDIETDIYTTDSADTSSADTVSSVPENPAEVSTVVVYRCPA
ncbi:hypothetical protein LPJ53_001009 [Coemansia erecta]|uniref:Uncharacterized protein n=1 Tax=Coemansia erecta TaxID=147472 RepID=A0A9W7Y0T5_9FUNG|nr:hypothetical protein LPJ53_001009 [Coemansia erecta]